VWSAEEIWKPLTASLIQYLDTCERDGLFKESYQYVTLKKWQLHLTDSLAKKIPYSWALNDLLLTDAFFHIIQDLKQGRLQADSLAWKHKKEKREQFFIKTLKAFQSGSPIAELFSSLQPANEAYLNLRKSIPGFLDSMDQHSYTYLAYPSKDSLAFQKKLLKRLGESGIIPVSATIDSAALADIISRYQRSRKIKETGKLSAALVKTLNNTDREKFKRIALTLDRYKNLPEKLPEKYIWVNIPSFLMKVWQNDTLVMESKVIVGTPGTPTPVLSSEISDIVVYPTWTIPNSIILKEILPALKKNPGYLARKGFGLYTYKGEPVDPYSVNWAKYTKGIPYLVRQGSGDNNALGVIKFNFKNPYDVYLHDTNQRSLFKNQNRSLSHGCVRVQNWEELAFYILRNDSIHSQVPDSLKISTDSIGTWIERKERHVVGIRKRLPVFIRYFGVEDVNGVIKFYDDIYGDDKRLRERYFAQN
jgi:murein L,D-transpeptidase YcbB/YkuD